MWDPGAGLMNDFFHGYQHSMFYIKNIKNKTCTCMHTIQDVWSYEYTQPPWAFTRMWATTRVKRVDMLSTWARTRRVGAISDGRYYGLLR